MAMGLFTEREFVVRQRGAFEVNPPQVPCAMCVPRGARESPGSCGGGGAAGTANPEEDVEAQDGRPREEARCARASRPGLRAKPGLRLQEGTRSNVDGSRGSTRTADGPTAAVTPCGRRPGAC